MLGMYSTCHRNDSDLSYITPSSIQVSALHLACRFETTIRAVENNASERTSPFGSAIDATAITGKGMTGPNRPEDAINPAQALNHTETRWQSDSLVHPATNSLAVPCMHCSEAYDGAGYADCMHDMSVEGAPPSSGGGIPSQKMKLVKPGWKVPWMVFTFMFFWMQFWLFTFLLKALQLGLAWHRSLHIWMFDVAWFTPRPPP